MATTQSKFKAGWKKLPLPVRGLIIAGGAYATYKAINALFGTNVQKAPVNYGQIPSVYTTQGGQQVLWDPDPLAKEIFTNIEGYNMYDYPDTMLKITKLNKDQAGLLYNHYNQYYAVEYPTLTQLIEAEWTSDPEYRDAAAHLKGFGLNERGKNMGKPTNRGLEALRALGYKI